MEEHPLGECLERLHTTELGALRIRRNLKLDTIITAHRRRE